jgi:putative ABC transport system permease protein
MEQVRQIDGITYVSLLREATVFSTGNDPVEIRAVSPQPNEARRPLLWGLARPEEVFAALDAGQVMVSEVFARRNNLPLNAPSTLTLITDTGPQSFQVAGIFYDYAAPELGYILMRLQTYQKFWQDRGISNVGLFLAPERVDQADAIAQNLQAQFAGQYALDIASNRGIKQGALEVFDRTFTITAALRLLATIVAFIGVLSALMSLQLERTRELGTLRANGMSAPQLWGKTMLETALMGLTAGLLAMPLGLILALILIYVINLRSFGWSLQLYLNPTIFITALGVALAAALLAGIYPIIRLNRLEIASALREE